MSTSHSSDIEQLRQRIADQRLELSGQLRCLVNTTAAPRESHRWGGIGLIAAGAVFVGLAAHRRSRSLLRSTVATGWLLWRATRLIRKVAAAFGQTSPPN